MLNLHNLPKLNYLEIRSLTLQFDGPAGGSPDVDLLGSDEALVELVRTGLFGSNGYLVQLQNFSSKYSRCFKARVIFPVKVNGLRTIVCCQSIPDMIHILILVRMRALILTTSVSFAKSIAATHQPSGGQ
jgi:hypothetical protein